MGRNKKVHKGPLGPALEAVTALRKDLVELEESQPTIRARLSAAVGVVDQVRALLDRLRAASPDAATAELVNELLVDHAEVVPVWMRAAGNVTRSFGVTLA